MAWVLEGRGGPVLVSLSGSSFPPRGSVSGFICQEAPATAAREEAHASPEVPRWNL